MNSDLFLLLGGIGMFLMGMDVMTSGLKEAAGSNLRQVLSRFTTTPLRGAITGAGATAIIQSSSATTVMTVGFVGAGLITLTQAVGVIFGANIGTTATGWLVSTLGFKLDLDAVAMVTLLPASLFILLGRGALARAGRVVAGLSLLLIGLEFMQGAVRDVTGFLTPETLPGAGFWGVLMLAGIGMVLTVVIQSSSATVALALLMLDGGVIDLLQAAAIVIGMNIGTTFTALLSSVGGSRVMRQTAIANLVFNIVTSVLAFPLLFALYGSMLQLAGQTGGMTVLMMFHTGFNLLGTAIMLPFVHQFVYVISRLVPDRAEAGIVELDRALLSDSIAALTASRAGLGAIARDLYAALDHALRDTPDYRPLSAAQHRVSRALDDIEIYLADVRLPADRSDEEQVLSALLHETDHLRRLLARSRQTAHLPALLSDRVLRRPAMLLGAILGRVAAHPMGGMEADRLERLNAIVNRRTVRHRRGLLLGEHAGLFSVTEVFEHTDAMRWLQRSLHHVERIGRYDRQARDGLRQQVHDASL